MKWPVETIDVVAQVNPKLAAADRPDLDEIVCFVPMAAVSEETLSIEAQAERPFSEVAKGYTPFKRGDVLVAKITPCFENGKMAFADNLAHELGFGTTEFHVFRPSERITGPYLFNLLRAPYVRKAGAIKMRGAAGQRRVPADFFAALQIPLPPLDEQKRIAGILDAADALRAKRREALAELDTLLQSTFLDIFGDPVTNPMGWDVVAFESIGNSRLGKMLDKGKEVGDCQFPYLANTNVQWGRFDLAALRTMDFSESDCEEFKLEDGDLLICEGGEVGRTAIWHGAHDRIYFQKALHRVRLNPTVAVPEYVFQFMWFMAKNGGFRDLTTSATIAHLTGVKLKRLPCPRPPLELQHRYAAIVKSVEQQKASQRAHLAELDTLFASLQSRAFRGDF